MVQVRHVPDDRQPQSAADHAGCMLVTALIPYLIFKRRGWL